MALSTPTTARWTILSSSVAMPSGRCRPSAFGMYARLHGRRPVAPLLHPCVQVPEVSHQVLPVGAPRHPVHARRGLRAQVPVGHHQPLQADMVQQRGEPRIPCPSALPRAHGPAHLTHLARHCVRGVFHRPCSPWFAPFPPPPPQPQPCSAGSQVLRSDPTARDPFIPGLPPRRSLSGPPGDQPGGQVRALPVLAHGGSVLLTEGPLPGSGVRLAGCGRYVTCLLRDVHCAGCCWRSTVSASVIVIADAPPGAASHCPLAAGPFSEVQNQFCGAGGCPGRTDRQQGLALRAPHSELTTASRFRQLKGCLPTE